MKICFNKNMKVRDTEKEKYSLSLSENSIFIEDVLYTYA